jgi:hypothetical protein
MVEDKYIVPFSCWIDEIVKKHGEDHNDIETIKEISQQKMNITHFAIKTIIKNFCLLFCFYFFMIIISVGIVRSFNICIFNTYTVHIKQKDLDFIVKTLLFLISPFFTFSGILFDDDMSNTNVFA